MQPQYADYYGGGPVRPTYKAPPLTYDSRGPNAGYRDYIQNSYRDMMANGGYNAERMRAISQRGASVYGGMQGRQTDRRAAYQPFRPGMPPGPAYGTPAYYMDQMRPSYGYGGYPMAMPYQRARSGLKSKAHAEFMLDNPEQLDLTFGTPQYGAPAPQFSGSLPSYGWQPNVTY